MKNSLKHVHKYRKLNKVLICACGKRKNVLKKRELKKFDRIEIEWVDSLHNSGWIIESKVNLSGKELLHKTLGYFLKEDKVSVIVFQSFQINVDPKSLDALMEIPKVAIKKIKKI